MCSRPVGFLLHTAEEEKGNRAFPRCLVERLSVRRLHDWRLRAPGSGQGRARMATAVPEIGGGRTRGFGYVAAVRTGAQVATSVVSVAEHGR